MAPPEAVGTPNTGCVFLSSLVWRQGPHKGLSLSNYSREVTRCSNYLAAVFMPLLARRGIDFNRGHRRPNLSLVYRRH